METAPYNPRPLDTSKVELTEELVRLSELFAQNAHDVWAMDRIEEGWKLGPERDDIKREHPCLVPFKELPEREKKIDRHAAVETLKTLISLGYRREKADSESMVLQGTDVSENVQKVIAAFKNPKINLAELRRQWEERVPLVWSQNVQIYRRAVDTALRLGEAFTAFDIAAEGLDKFKNDLRLIQLQALALARTGATRRANALLEQLRLSGHQDEETMGILARTHKDFWLLSADPDEKRKHLKTSYELYAESYKKNRGYYSGINAASMGLIYGDKQAARQMGQEVLDTCIASLKTLAPESDERYWLEATIAEAALIMGNLDMAEDYYRRGSAAGQSTVVLSRTRIQARLLLEHITGNSTQLDHCFELPRIAVFSGHMFDRPGRKNPRFPVQLESEVRQQLDRRLRGLKASVGYSSLACGGDLVFAESLLAHGGEVNVVLPFKKDDFKRASVEITPGTNWGDRFDLILKNAATVNILNEQGDPNDGAAYDFCNQALSGLALLKSQFLGMDVYPVVVWDGLIGDGKGGTQSFVDFWRNKRNMPVEIIALKDLLEQVPPIVIESNGAKPQTAPAAPAAPAAAPVPPPSPIAMTDIEPQEIKAMIFADIVGYTKLSEIQIPAFVKQFMGQVAALMDKMKNPPLHRNTWGDAICAVFEHVSDAGIFALNLRDLVRGTDWLQYGLPNELNIRIALHAGPVFPCYDPVLKKKTYNGSHVNRTARIEPVAEEGQIYASEAFAALSAADSVAEFTCDYVGTKQLAKKYGAIPVFLVRRTV